MLSVMNAHSVCAQTCLMSTLAPDQGASSAEDHIDCVCNEFMSKTSVDASGNVQLTVRPVNGTDLDLLTLKMHK